MTATAERIDFGSGVLDIDLETPLSASEFELANKTILCGIVGDWLQWTDELHASVVAEHRRIGRTLTELEVYKLATSRPEFVGLVRRRPDSE
jgi:hypothetical protein